MLDLFQKHFSFRAVVYTNSKLVRSFAQPLGIYCEGKYELNPYGMPLASYMFNRTKYLVNADYYGYINSDIIISPNLFEILELSKKLVESGTISKKVNNQVLGERCYTLYIMYYRYD